MTFHYDRSSNRSNSFTIKTKFCPLEKTLCCWIIARQTCPEFKSYHLLYVKVRFTIDVRYKYHVQKLQSYPNYVNWRRILKGKTWNLSIGTPLFSHYSCRKWPLHSVKTVMRIHYTGNYEFYSKKISAHLVNCSQLII